MFRFVSRYVIFEGRTDAQGGLGVRALTGGSKALPPILNRRGTRRTAEGGRMTPGDEAGLINAPRPPEGGSPPSERSLRSERQRHHLSSTSRR